MQSANYVGLVWAEMYSVRLVCYSGDSSTKFHNNPFTSFGEKHADGQVR